jgi:hypothetical protein
MGAMKGCARTDDFSPNARQVRKSTEIMEEDRLAIFRVRKAGRLSSENMRPRSPSESKREIEDYAIYRTDLRFRNAALVYSKLTPGGVTCRTNRRQAIPLWLRDGGPQKRNQTEEFGTNFG